MSSGDDGRGADDETSADSGRTYGFRLELGLQSLSDLLGGLRGASGGSSPVPGNAGRRTNLGERPGGRRTTGGDSQRRRTDRERESGERCLIDTRLDDGAFVVVAELPGATEDDLSVGIDRRTNELVIARDGTVAGRVDLPWASSEATRVRFNNGVLEVRLRPGDGDA